MKKRFLPTMSFRARLIGITLITVLFFNAIVGTLLYFNIQDGFRTYIVDSLASGNIDHAQKVANVLQNSKDRILNASKNAVLLRYLKTKDNDAEVNQLFSILNLDKTFATLTIFDRNGTVIKSTETSIVGKNFAFRDYFRRAITGSIYTDVLISSVSNDLGFFQSIPIFDEQNMVIGVFVARIQTANIFSEIYNADSQQSRENNHVILLDEFGVVIYSDRPELIFHTLGVPSQNTQLLIQKKWGSMGVDPTPVNEFVGVSSYLETYNDVVSTQLINNGEEYNTTITRVPNLDFFLVHAINSSITSSAIEKLTSPLIIYIALLIILLSLILFVIISDFLKPLVIVRAFVASVSRGDVSSKLDIETIQDYDFKELGSELNQMTENIRESQTKLEERVREKTRELDERIQELESTKRSIINVLEDLEQSKTKVEIQRAQTTAILESVEHAVVVVNPNGIVTFANHVATRVLNIKEAKQLIGKRLSEIVHIHDFKDKEVSIDSYLLDRAVREGKSSIVRAYIVKPDESRFPAFSVFSPIEFNGEIIGAVAVMRDITEEKRLEDVRVSFISTAAHQLRTPLTAISWFSEMLLDEMGNVRVGEEKEMAEQIYRSVKRMIDFVNMLLQVARVEAGRVRVLPTPQNPATIFEDVARSLDPILKETIGKHIVIRNELDPSTSIPLDREIFWQVAQNLLTNAIRYSNNNTQIDVLIRDMNTFIECSVTNTGIGIPEKERSKIFQRFYRASNAVKSVPEGSGLGLALVKLIVDEWGGAIWFDVDEDGRTQFIFTLPKTGMKERAGEVGLNV